ncbi:MAG: hypothetical protein ACXACA_02820 [Candidatus Ranarchaeia archaeon]
MTSGIGARTALSIRCISTKKPQQSLPQTSAINAKQKNATEIANMQSNMILQMFQSRKQGSSQIFENKEMSYSREILRVRIAMRIIHEENSMNN